MGEILLQLPTNVPVPEAGSAYDAKLLAFLVAVLLTAFGLTVRYFVRKQDKRDAERDRIEEERRIEDKEESKQLAKERNELLLRLETARNDGQAKALEEITKGFEQLRKDAAEHRGAVGTELSQLRGLLQDVDRRLTNVENRK